MTLFRAEDAESPADWTSLNGTFIAQLCDYLLPETAMMRYAKLMLPAVACLIALWPADLFAQPAVRRAPARSAVVPGGRYVYPSYYYPRSYYRPFYYGPYFNFFYGPYYSPFWGFYGQYPIGPYGPYPYYGPV